MEIEELIEARPKGRKRQLDWYRQLISTADRSGLSSSELASRAGCSLGTIYNWRRRLAGDHSPEGAADAEKPRLVQVRVSPNPPSPAPGEREPALELRLTCGRSVLVRPNFDGASLVSLLEVLDRC